MFKSAEQIKTFVDAIELFVRANNLYMDSPNADTAAVLNKARTTLETVLSNASGITTYTDTTVDTYLCPECGKGMILRTNRQNGQKFWGCKGYPSCKGTRDENGLSREEREEQKYKQEQAIQQSGFSFNRDKRNPVAEVSPPVEVKETWLNMFSKK